MEKIELTAIANQLSLQIDIEKIYYVQYVDNSIDFYKLLILISSISERKNSEIEPFVQMVLEEQTSVTFKIYRSDEVREALKNGNIYFFISCSRGNLIYDRPDKQVIPSISSTRIAGWKTSVLERFNAWTNKTTSFLVGADFYYNKGDTNLTAFMLHQVLELTYRSLISALLIKEKKTHDLGELQEYVFSHLPQTGRLFQRENPEDSAILKKLNKAYSSVRYQQNHLVDDKIIPILFKRVETLQTVSKWIIDEIIEILEAEYQRALIEEPKSNNFQFDTMSENDLNEDIEGRFFGSSGKFKNAVTLIVEFLSPDYVYLFGNQIIHSINSNLFTIREINKSALHYDLLIISTKSNAHSTNIYKAIEKLGDITVNLLIHSPQEVLNKIERGNRFFSTVIQEGQLILKKIDLPDLSAELKPLLQNKSSYNPFYPSARLNRSLALLKSANQLGYGEPNTATMFFALSVEQICLGLIHIYMGYIPNIYSLSHLFKICKIFWPTEHPFFPTEKERDVNVVNILSKSTTEVRYHVGASIELEIFEVLVSRCNSFIGLAIQICQTELIKNVKLLNA